MGGGGGGGGGGVCSEVSVKYRHGIYISKEMSQLN